MTNLPNDPGQYPGRPSPGAGFFHMPGCESAHGGPCYCFMGGGPGMAKPQYTPQQREAQRHVNKLRIVNLVLFFPFLLLSLISLTQYEIPHYRARYDEILPGVIALIILVFVIRNKVIKARLRHRYDVN